MTPISRTASRSARRRHAGGAAPIPLIIVAVLFLLVIAYLVASSLFRESIPTFEPQVLRPSVRGDTLVTDTVTIDASTVNRWRFFDFALGSTVEPPDTAGWDLAFRRFHVMSRAVADLGPLPFDSVVEAPATGYVATVFGADTTNAALDRWYRYNILTHQLEPNGHVYVIRTSDDRVAKIDFLSYYCTGTQPGCVTFRYAYQGGPSRMFR